MSARVCIGGKVFVCSNRAFHAYTDDCTGVVGMALHPHRINVYDGLYQRIDNAFSTIEDYRRSQENFYDRLQNTRLTQDEAYALIVRSAQNGIINKIRILNVAQQWDWNGQEPETEIQRVEWNWHPEFVGRNAFSLFNAFTQVEKARLEKNPVHSHIQTMGLTEFFYREYPVD